MENARLQELLNFLKEEPGDPFILYAIATEYGNVNSEKAKEYYSKLLISHSDYLPTYYHAAKLYERLGDIKKASELYKKGIELSFAQKDMKIHRELSNALNELENNE